MTIFTGILEPAFAAARGGQQSALRNQPSTFRSCGWRHVSETESPAHPKRPRAWKTGGRYASPVMKSAANGDYWGLGSGNPKTDLPAPAAASSVNSSKATPIASIVDTIWPS